MHIRIQSGSFTERNVETPLILIFDARVVLTMMVMMMMMMRYPWLVGWLMFFVGWAPPSVRAAAQGFFFFWSATAEVSLISFDLGCSDQSGGGRKSKSSKCGRYFGLPEGLRPVREVRVAAAARRHHIVPNLLYVTHGHIYYMYMLHVPLCCH